VEEYAYGEILSATTEPIVVESFVSNMQSEVGRKIPKKVASYIDILYSDLADIEVNRREINSYVGPLNSGNDIIIPEYVYGEILSATTESAMINVNSFLNCIITGIESIDYEEPPLIVFDNNNYKYGNFDNIIVNNDGKLELKKTREQAEMEGVSDYETTQEGWGYGYGYEIEVTESVVIKDVKALYTTDQVMNMKACVFEKDGVNWNKIAEAVNESPQLTEDWAEVTGLDVILIAGKTYRVIHYSQYARDLHWTDRDIHPIELSFGQTTTGVSDSSQYNAEGQVGTHKDRNIYLKLTVDGVYEEQGGYISGWEFNGFNVIYNALQTVSNLPDGTSATIKVQTSDDRENIVSEKSFDVREHSLHYMYDIAELATGLYSRVGSDRI